MENAAELFFLPSLRKVALFDVNLSSMSNLVDRATCQRISPVTHLTVYPRCNPCLIHSESLKACLQVPRMLVSLTLQIPGSLGESGEDNMIAYDKMWEMLCFHEQSLEYLDFFDRGALQHWAKSQRKFHLGLLCKFRNLRTLRIQLVVLLGGQSGVRRAAHGLRSTIPEALYSLTL